MKLTLNEMLALARLVDEALKREDLKVDTQAIPEVRERWELAKAFLKDIGGGAEYVGGTWKFYDRETAVAVRHRLADLIAEERDILALRREQRRSARAAWLSALAAAVSAAAALYAATAR